MILMRHGTAKTPILNQIYKYNDHFPKYDCGDKQLPYIIQRCEWRSLWLFDVNFLALGVTY